MMTCGSTELVRRLPTVPVWPPRTWTWCLVLMSHTRATESTANDYYSRTADRQRCWLTSPAGDQNIECGVETQAVDAAEVSVIVADDLVVLEVPACVG